MLQDNHCGVDWVGPRWVTLGDIQVGTCRVKRSMPGDRGLCSWPTDHHGHSLSRLENVGYWALLRLQCGVNRKDGGHRSDSRLGVGSWPKRASQYIVERMQCEGGRGGSILETFQCCFPPSLPPWKLGCFSSTVGNQEVG